MSLMINSRLFASLLVSYNSMFLSGASNIYLCVGTTPTDAQIDAMTAVTDALIVNNKAVTYGGYPLTNIKLKDTSIPALNYLNILPSPNTVNSVKAGTISWGVLYGNDSRKVCIVDVGLANSGAVIQVDTTTVIVGTPVTLLGIAYKLGR